MIRAVALATALAALAGGAVPLTAGDAFAQWRRPNRLTTAPADTKATFPTERSSGKTPATTGPRGDGKTPAAKDPTGEQSGATPEGPSRAPSPDESPATAEAKPRPRVGERRAGAAEGRSREARTASSRARGRNRRRRRAGEPVAHLPADRGDAVGGVLARVPTARQADAQTSSDRAADRLEATTEGRRPPGDRPEALGHDPCSSATSTSSSARPSKT